METLGLYFFEGRKQMKKKICIAAILMMLLPTVTGCTQANRVSANLSKEADNFNDVRQMTGKMSITADTSDNQLEVVVEDENGEYKKHFIGLSDNVAYVVEDITADDVSNYKYTLNFNPKMWLPVEVKTID